jgi:putative hydrolase of the HAD superfamily
MQAFKNIIFDFGGVIIDIDYQVCIQSFKNLGIKDFDEWYSQARQHDLFDHFEIGKISASEFRQQVRQTSGINLSDNDINAAWNSILIRLPDENIELLKRLKSDYRLFLLSNTNEIHEQAFTQIITENYQGNILEKLFDKIYFSHKVHMRKPHAEIFELVLSENNLAASETLFIDDSLQHIEGAAKVGIQTKWLETGKRITELF